MDSTSPTTLGAFQTPARRGLSIAPAVSSAELLRAAMPAPASDVVTLGANPEPALPRARDLGAVISTTQTSTGQPKPTEQAQELIDTAAVAAAVGKDLKNGESVTFTADGRTVLQVKKQGERGITSFADFTADAIRAAAAETSNVIAQDPSFAFKEAALLVKTPVYSGVDPTLTGLAEQAFLPMIRVVGMVIDASKAVETWHSNRAHKMDRAVDTAHVGTDFAGVGGAVLSGIPGCHAVGFALTCAGIVGDVASYGYHVMKYFRDRASQGPLGDPGPNKQTPVPLASVPVTLTATAA